MTSYIGAELRRLVELRANYTCEYCLIQQADTYLGCQVDPIIAEKHGGLTEAENLAFACAVCNRAKGSDIASLVPVTRTLVRLFNPRVDRWHEHFRIEAISLQIDPLTEIGQVTAGLLGLNGLERVLERQLLARIGHYPILRRPPK